MATINENYYTGVRTFEWLSDIVGLPVDQMNFVLSQFTALILAGLLRIWLKPDFVTPATRHAYGLVGGLALGSFCFGHQAVHLAGLPALCYIAMRTQNPKIMQRVVLAVALAYLSGVHFYRQIYAYGSYTLDITGPLMVITQKVISLAYSIHDGITRIETDLTPLQRHQAVKIMPTALEYFSYVFHFQGLMAGPVIFYRDYIDFIHGNRLKGRTSFTGFYSDWSNKLEEIVVEPSPMKAVIKKVIASLTCAVIFVTFMPQYPMQRVKERNFLDHTSLPYKMWYLMISTMVVRFKYYYAWLFADAICNNSGMGYNGIDVDGNARWDLISNVDILGFELSLSLRDSIEAWNKGTNRWLRMVAYERGGRYKIILTYGLSALWHGFYPGYYLTFASAALATMGARSVRRHIRPLFLRNKFPKLFYDCLTFIVTRLFMACYTFSFVLLEFIPSIELYFAMYLIPHLLALAAIFILPSLPLAKFNRLPSVNIPDEKPSTSQPRKVGESAGQSDNNQNESNNVAEVRNGHTKKLE